MLMEAGMADIPVVTEVRLSGQWSNSGVILQIESISALQHLAAGLENLYRIDCGDIDSIDMAGFQLLHVWLKCIALRGAQPELVNLPEGMKQTIRRLGLERCFSEYIPVTASGPADSIQMNFVNSAKGGTACSKT